MFIVHVAKSYFISSVRSVICAGQPNISLLRSEKDFSTAWFYRHFVPLGLKSGAPTALIYSANFRDRTLADFLL